MRQALIVAGMLICASSCLCDNRQTTATIHPTSVVRGVSEPMIFVMDEDMFIEPYDDLVAQHLVLHAYGPPGSGDGGTRGELYNWSDQAHSAPEPFSSPRIQNARIIHFNLEFPSDWPVGVTTIGVGAGQAGYGLGTRATATVDVR